MREILVGGLKFSTKSQAERHIRWILGRYPKRGALVGGDAQFIHTLIEQHPRKDVIVNCGLKRVEVDWYSNDTQRHFVAVRKDDSIRDFSWRSLLYPRSAIEQVRRVCRTLIQDQIRTARARAFARDIAITCPVSGRKITADTCDIDHAPPNTFAVLVDGWLRLNRLEAEDIEIIASPVFQEPDCFQDAFLADNWREYHQINARLRALDRMANRSTLRRKGYTDGDPERAA